MENPAYALIREILASEQFRTANEQGRQDAIRNILNHPWMMAHNITRQDVMTLYLQQMQFNRTVRGAPVGQPPTAIVAIQGDPTQRKKIETKQIKTNAEPKTKKTPGRVINKKEKEYMLAKRLQKFSEPAEAAQVVIPAVPARLIQLSDAEKVLRQKNLEDRPLTEPNLIIPEQVLQHCLPDKGGINLHEYQLRVVRFMLQNRGIIVDHSVGSGKTLIASTFTICVLRFPSLIPSLRNRLLRVIFVGPKTLLANFELTLNKAFSNVDWNRIDLYTYEKFTLDHQKGLINCDNSVLIVDEAHRLRTHSQTCQGQPHKPKITVLSLLKCAHRATKVLLLTATPIVNDPYDIVNLITLIRGDLLSIEKKTFRKTIYSKKGEIVNRMAFDNFFRGTLDIYVRPHDHTYPTVNMHVVRIEMSEKYYREYMRVEDLVVSQIQEDVLGNSGDELEPFYNGVRRTVNADIEEFNSKLDWVRRHLLKFNNRKMLMFSPFISLGVNQLEKLVADFDVAPRFGHIIGDDTAGDRQQTIDDFNADRLQVLLNSIGAGGLGISLMGTRDVVLMQPGWNDVEMQQAIGRAVRFHSHTHLPLEQRTVEVWKLLLVKPAQYAVPGAKLAADEIIESIIARKEAIIQPFLERLSYLQ